MRRLTNLLAVGVLAVPLWSTGVPDARAVGPTACTFGGLTLVLTPALTATTRPFTFQNSGPGWIDCSGPVLGQEPTGRGRWMLDRGTATGSCAGGKGDFVFDFRIPTRGGIKTITDRGTFAYGPLKGGAYGGEFDGNTMSGQLSVSPKKGNCLTEPLSETLPTARGVMRA